MLFPQTEMLVRWWREAPSLLHHKPVSMPLCKEIWSQLLSWAQIQNSWFLFSFLPCAAHGITLSFINLLVTTSLNTGQLLSAVRWLLQSNTHPMPICREEGGEGVQVFASHLSVYSRYSWHGAKPQTYGETRLKEWAGTQLVETF